MKRIPSLIVATSLLAVMLTGCGAKDATLEDCVNHYLAQGKPADVLVEVCTRILDQKGQDGFNELFAD
ncbi:hypothetical protein [Mycetocola saprophilus]|uniref:hypothetical protein n=1 Tax=Mycetocola saprophilus TaxID=76636 RepID=UPI003BF35CB1